VTPSLNISITAEEDTGKQRQIADAVFAGHGGDPGVGNAEECARLSRRGAVPGGRRRFWRDVAFQLYLCTGNGRARVHLLEGRAASTWMNSHCDLAASARVWVSVTADD
jgi:hypothetical protein